MQKRIFKNENTALMYIVCYNKDRFYSRSKDGKPL